MLPTSQADLLDHVRWLRQAVAAVGAEFLIVGDSQHALIRRDGAHWVLHPRFLGTLGGTARLTYELTDFSTTFAGWLPYRGKYWPLAGDKLAFKRYAAAAGLRVPEFTVAPTAATRDVLITRPRSSFGQHTRGPFRSAQEQPLDLTQGEYFEPFIQGEILKVWYWNETPAVAERIVMPYVTGDGGSTLRELIRRRARLRTQATPEELEPVLAECAVVLRFFGLDLDSVLPKDATQLVDFRCASVLRAPGSRFTVDFASTTEVQPGWLDVFRRAGPALAAAIPQEARADTLFTVDAIVDEAGSVWFLEMNSNPVSHPLAYPAMVRSILGAADAPALGTPSPAVRQSGGPQHLA